VFLTLVFVVVNFALLTQHYTCICYLYTYVCLLSITRTLAKRWQPLPHYK